MSKVFFTDGQGALVERDLPHCPDLDVPSLGGCWLVVSNIFYIFHNIWDNHG